MKIVITGSLGHISKPLTEQLVQKGHSVTVISSKPEKQKEIEALGATAAIGSLEDKEFLTNTFSEADAVYTMIPPPDFSDPNLDPMKFTNTIANNYVQAITKAGIQRVVHLSSIGAHLDKDSGLILVHHAVEGIMDTLSDVAITYMRPTAFYYNLYSFSGAIKNSGAIAANYGGEDRVPWVSPIDIAAAITEEFETPIVGKKIRYVASDELSCNEVASILGAAIGKPDLKWIVIPDEQMKNGLKSFGIPAQIASGLVEMNASMHNGKLFEDYYLHKPTVMGKIKMTHFAKEFAEVYKQS